ncbi:sodium:solute symporter family protein [Nafulsella turpanensis]|uniref:sodium:solute symporter family protein n=1 Tax=Nafulsella turpanensis TaxID=1265690 RepID=UPI00034CE63F|nr:sodium:solute symporter family protein [Nafulsella turpanensis]
MELALADWIVIGVFLAITIFIGLYFRKKAGQDIDSFFLGGRNLPWWIAGTSMVATTFAADTPLAVTELVANNGIAGNWVWWNMLIGGMLTTFFFAKYWRRAEILTDVEFIEMRYSGKEASFLRGFKAVYLGLFMNALVIGWVNVALMSLLKVFFGIPDDMLLWYVFAAMLVVVLYSSVSGLLGVAFTDVVQFIIAMGGCIVLAWLVLDSPKVGGISGLKEQLPEWSLSFFPQIGSGSAGIGTTLAMGFGSFFAIIGLQWWASWYPGNEPGGGGYIAQRMMAAKDEKNAIYATLFFQIAHYALRPWPWIIVALCAVVLYPDLPADDKKLGYVMAMKDYLPDGLRGLLLVAFFAAYMSTISTQLNWGTSYLINDLYKRFIAPGASSAKLVAASRIGTGLLMLFALLITSQIETISGVWVFIIEAGAGLGLVLILRWYWWRINAWSEIAATAAPLFAYALTKYVFVQFDSAWGLSVLEDPRSFLFILGFTTISWIVVTYLTKPTNFRKLEEFYAKVRPLGNWKPFERGIRDNVTISYLVVCWLSAVVMAYSVLFFIGHLIFRNWIEVLIYGTISLISFFILKKASDKVDVFADDKKEVAA